MRRTVAAGAALAVILLDSPILAAAAPPPPDAAIGIDNFSFVPAQVTVAPGTTVVWTNHDDIPHTVTSADDPRAFGSAPLDTDQPYAHRFDHAGRFRYFCLLHSHMQGTVVVR